MVLAGFARRVATGARCDGVRGLTMDDPRVTTWANGFGVWHARVPAECVSPLIAARRALRDEIVPRDAHAHRDVWMHPVRVPELDEPGTIVYREGETEHPHDVGDYSDVQ
jgi:hypothetical protein